MVVDTIQNIGLYKGLGAGLTQAFEYLMNTNLQALPAGKYMINGDDLFAIVNEYETKDGAVCEQEAHRKYIDVQYMVSGTELFGYAPLQNQVPVQAYHAEQDYAVYSTKVCRLQLRAGMFAIFYPTDVHQPEVMVDEPIQVKKVVLKVKIAG